jgi:catechol 2,3-dioxygenase-like lactoylglutathione lyase family enzyme
MERVLGIGGVFFKAKDPAALAAWYERHLGLTLMAHGISVFTWREHDSLPKPAYTVWAPFPRETKYFGSAEASFMLNFRVASLDRMLSQLRAAGVVVDDKIEESEFGRFGWAEDPEGNRIELWEPAA